MNGKKCETPQAPSFRFSKLDLRVSFKIENQLLFKVTRGSNVFRYLIEKMSGLMRSNKSPINVLLDQKPKAIMKKTYSKVSLYQNFRNIGRDTKHWFYTATKIGSRLWACVAAFLKSLNPIIHTASWSTQFTFLAWWPSFCMKHLS